MFCFLCSTLNIPLIFNVCLICPCFFTGELFTSRSRPRPLLGWWAARECCSSCCANSAPFSATRSRPVSCGQVWNILERNTPSYTGLPDHASTPGQLQRSTRSTQTPSYIRPGHRASVVLEGTHTTEPIVCWPQDMLKDF